MQECYGFKHGQNVWFIDIVLEREGYELQIKSRTFDIHDLHCQACAELGRFFRTERQAKEWLNHMKNRPTKEFVNYTNSTIFLYNEKNELIGKFEPSIGKTINVINVGKEHLSTVNGMPIYQTKSLYITGLEDVQAHQVPIVSNKVLDALKRMSLAGNNPFDFLIVSPDLGSELRIDHPRHPSELHIRNWLTV